MWDNTSIAAGSARRAAVQSATQGARELAVPTAGGRAPSRPLVGHNAGSWEFGSACAKHQASEAATTGRPASMLMGQTVTVPRGARVIHRLRVERSEA